MIYIAFLQRIQRVSNSKEGDSIYIAFYARQSIDKENSVSIETQLEYCKSMIKPDEKSYKAKSFCDKGFSGKDTNRPAFQKLLKEIKLGKIKKVIVYKLDRISRSLIDFVDMLQEFKKHSVEFVSSQECFDSASPYGEMISKLLMVFAEFERASIINRIKDAYDKRSSMGLYSGGRRVYGYNLESTTIQGIKTKKFVPNIVEAKHIKYIFDLYAVPGATLCGLQKNLLKNGIKPLCGADWTTGKLGTIIKNPIYVKADINVYNYYQKYKVNIINDVNEFDGSRNLQLYGKTTHNKSLPDWSDMKIVLLESPGLIDSDTWLKCQFKLEKNKQIGCSMSNHTSWLSGKLMCSKCRHTMTTIKSETKKYFVCSGKTHKKTCSGIKSTIYVDDIENMVDNCISNKLSALKLTHKTHINEMTSQINTFKIKIKDIENQEQSLSSAILNNSLNNEMIEILNKKAKTFYKEKAELLNKIEELNKSSVVDSHRINFSKKWLKASFNERRAVCNVLIHTIIVYENGSFEIIWNI